MVSRKRTRAEVDLEDGPAKQEEEKPKIEEAGREGQQEQQQQQPSLTVRLRNCWEFANLMQYIHFFGRIVRIDEDLDIDVCCLPRYRVFPATMI